MQHTKAQDVIREMLKEATPAARDAFMSFAEMCDAFALKFEEIALNNPAPRPAESDCESDSKDDGEDR